MDLLMGIINDFNGNYQAYFILVIDNSDYIIHWNHPLVISIYHPYIHIFIDKSIEIIHEESIILVNPLKSVP